MMDLGDQTRFRRHIQCAIQILCLRRKGSECNVLVQSSQWKTHMCWCRSLKEHYSWSMASQWVSSKESQYNQRFRSIRTLRLISIPYYRYIVSDCDSVDVFFNQQHYTSTPEEAAAASIKAGELISTVDVKFNLHMDRWGQKHRVVLQVWIWIVGRFWRFLRKARWRKGCWRRTMSI